MNIRLTHTLFPLLSIHSLGVIAPSPYSSILRFYRRSSYDYPCGQDVKLTLSSDDRQTTILIYTDTFARPPVRLEHHSEADDTEDDSNASKVKINCVSGAKLVSGRNLISRLLGTRTPSTLVTCALSSSSPSGCSLQHFLRLCEYSCVSLDALYVKTLHRRRRLSRRFRGVSARGLLNIQSTSCF